MVDATESEVFQSALSLPKERRAEPAEQLWLGLSDGTQDEISTASAEELNRRLTALEDGRTTTTSVGMLRDVLTSRTEDPIKVVR